MIVNNRRVVQLTNGFGLTLKTWNTQMMGSTVFLVMQWDVSVYGINDIISQMTARNSKYPVQWIITTCLSENRNAASFHAVYFNGNISGHTADSSQLSAYRGQPNNATY